MIILGRSAGLEKFGTIKPVSLNSLAFDEYMYLFKTLAFGSTNPTDYPRLAAMVEEFATVLGGSFITANVLADALRKNLSAHFWLYRLRVPETLSIRTSLVLVPTRRCFLVEANRYT